MPIDLYPSVTKVKRNGAWQNLPGFVPEEGDNSAQAMIANTETSTTAQYTHPKDSFFRLNNTLYQADADIPVNGTIAVGTNCHVAVLGNNVYELIEDVDSQSENINSVDEEIFYEKQILDLTVHSSTNSSVTYNSDGSITIGTTDYGNTFIGGNITLQKGTYYLFGVPNGMSFVSTTASHNTAFVTNNTNAPKKFTIDSPTSCYVGFRVSSRPSESFTIYPALYQKTSIIDDIDNDISTLKTQYHKIYSDYPTVKFYPNTSGKWGNDGSSNIRSICVPVHAGDGISIIDTVGKGCLFAFVKSIPESISLGDDVDYSSTDGFNGTFQVGENNTFNRNFKVPTDANYIVVMSKYLGGADRLPTSIIINWFDIVSGEFVNEEIYGGTTGAINTLLSKSSKLICTIIDDDAQNTASMQALYEVCEDNDIKCTIASLTDKWSLDSDLKQKLYDLESAGYQIVLHAYTQGSDNNWQDIDSRLADYEANFTHGLRDLHQAGFANCDFWVTPGGIQTESAQMLARKYGMKALIAGVEGINLIDATNTINGTNTGLLSYRDNSRWRIRRADLKYADEESWTLQNLKDIALRGTYHGAWLILCTHAYQWYNDETKRSAFESRLAEFVSYAKGIGYEFMTLGEAWTYKEPAFNLYDMR